MKIFIAGDIKEENKNEAPVLVGDYLLRYLLKKGIDVSYLTYFKEGARFSRKQKLFGSEKINEHVFRGGVFPLLRYIIKNKPDVIHLINIEFFYLPFYLLKLFLRFKVVYTVHGLVSYELNFRNHPLRYRLRSRFIEWMNFHFADKLIFLAKMTADLSNNINPAKKVILDNGIITEKIRKNYCEEIAIRFSKIAFIANEYEGERKEKGLDLLIEFLNNCPEEFLINFYGSRENKETASGNVKIRRHSFLNEDELSAELVNNDIFIAPSRIDTFNLGLLKAMSLGMLFLCSNKVGLSERFDESKKKFIYHYDDEKDFRMKLEFLSSLDNTERDEYSRSFKSFADKFDWDNIIQNYIALYKNLVS